MAYCIYLRKSRADLEAEAQGIGETLARHEKTLCDLAKKLDIDIDKIHKEIVSGETISDRPIMQKLIAEVEAGNWNGVLVTEIERLARGDTIDQGIVARAFKNSNTKIITPTKIYDPSNEFDEEYFEFGLFMSRREYKTINRRIQAGKLSAAKEGKYVPGIPPYGYERIKLKSEKGFSLAENKEEATAVKLIYDLFTEYSQTIHSICNTLDSMNIKPRNCSHWQNISIGKILTNPVYTGKIVWGREKTIRYADSKTKINNNDFILAKGIHNPIITQNQWDKAQKIINTNKMNHTKNNFSLQNPFAGIIFCGICKSIMVRHTNKKGYPPIIRCSNKSCINISHNIYYVENLMIEALKKWYSNYTIPYNNTNYKKPSIESITINQIIIKLKTLESQIEKAYDLLEQGVYSLDIFNNRIIKLNNDRDKLMDTKTQLESSLSKHDMKPEVILEENLIKLYKNLPDIESKNILLKELLYKVEYIKKKGDRNYPNIELLIFPKIM